MPSFARRDMTRFTRSDIAPAGRSDIIFAYKTRKANTTQRKLNITAKQ